jgi:GAF domain-containing protein
MITDLVEKTVRQTMQMMEDGIPQHKILACLVSAAEKIAGDNAVSSILVLDKNGLLRNGSSPGLPYDYLTAIDGLKPNPNVGTCAAAAATGLMVVTSDFRADNKWAELRHLPLALGFVGAWSMPIKNSDGKVLGTFGTYFRERREPSEEEINSIKSLALAAARVLTGVKRQDAPSGHTNTVVN